MSLVTYKKRGYPRPRNIVQNSRLVIAWMTGLMFPLLGLALGSHPLSWLAVYGLCAAQVAWLFSRVGTFRRGVALG